MVEENPDVTETQEEPVSPVATGLTSGAGGSGAGLGANNPPIRASVS